MVNQPAPCPSPALVFCEISCSVCTLWTSDPTASLRPDLKPECTAPARRRRSVRSEAFSPTATSQLRGMRNGCNALDEWASSFTEWAGLAGILSLRSVPSSSIGMNGYEDEVCVRFKVTSKRADFEGSAKV